ncbi:hypothetical protein [Paenarthrobacter sp. YJN-5]|uniref:hypothetical protein n=1 Tax=unclassified Paenarthrobacter TaxID=2634190 RepID=UPI0018778FCE|nr:hypothetical protein [Paenarthrobacter sp. YJN-5]QOT19522.1 hypothetical protein HMI59_23100 [Paenarthrobacter sp. YJN-5]
MTTAAMSARHAAHTLVDPALGKKAWAHESTGRHYVPQSLRGYLLGRALDVVIVAAASFALAKGRTATTSPRTTNIGTSAAQRAMTSSTPARPSTCTG